MPEPSPRRRSSSSGVAAARQARAGGRSLAGASAKAGGALAVLGPALMLAGVWAEVDRRWLALGLLALVLLRWGGWLFRKAPSLLILGAAACLWAALARSQATLRAYPVMVNSVLLAVFAQSLAHPPTVIERLARLRRGDLDPAAVAYTRKVTVAWCIFFALNGALALATALWASERSWALYNGGIAYALMGLLFAIEWVIRQRVQREHQDRP